MCTSPHVTWLVVLESLVHLAVGTFANVGLEPLVLGGWRGLRERQSFQATAATGKRGWSRPSPTQQEKRQSAMTQERPPDAAVVHMNAVEIFGRAPT